MRREIDRRAARLGAGRADLPGEVERGEWRVLVRAVAAFAGYGLRVEVREGSPTVDRLVDDLRRLGPVDHRVVVATSGTSITPQARALLGLLAEGLTLGEAAASLGLSRRTADRRIADARRALGAERTTEAITLARRAGWLRASLDDPAGE